MKAKKRVKQQRRGLEREYERAEVEMLLTEFTRGYLAALAHVLLVLRGR